MKSIDVRIQYGSECVGSMGNFKWVERLQKGEWVLMTRVLGGHLL